MEMREDSGQRMRRILQETAANFLYREVPQIDAEDHTSIPDVESSIQQIDTREKNDDIGVLSDHSRSFQDNDLENVDPLESTSHEELNEELGMGVEPNDWQASGFQQDEWKNSIKEDINKTQLESITLLIGLDNTRVRHIEEIFICKMPLELHMKMLSLWRMCLIG